ncbi:WecB/TagA/CpsF family glycosyltransferase [Granulicella arctica]|uniref:WecB/TagA/CpsF family glycosyltransferase n=1 Tax=Granulicella arctica TaxID=940613 RepID=UPI0021E02E10|nr:WecB/TagA/CpsF family glycosyltransferase [Granulicella arctica]
MENINGGAEDVFRKILGVNFFDGNAAEAIAKIRHGGLLVVPAAPALKDMDRDIGYRDALLGADLVITDSALMVLIWNLIERDSLYRLSGLEYLKELLEEPDVRQTGNTVWIMASPKSAATNLKWLAESGIVVDQDYVYMAPMYGSEMEDPKLVALLNRLRPQHVIVTIGGGTQERLGLYLKQNLDYLPAIHCIGAAIAFLSGDQVQIPMWGDRFYLGWLMRCLSEPKRYVPRYWEARKLVGLMLRYRSELPMLRTG